MMTTLLEDIFAVLSDFKVGAEVKWEDQYGIKITIEPLNIKKGRFILRHYNYNGNKLWQISCKKDKRSGKSIIWHENGGKAWEMEFVGGLMDGRCLGWDEFGNVICDEEYAGGVYRS